MRVRNVKEQPPSESSKWRRPENAAGEPRHLLPVEGRDATGHPDLGREGRVGALHGAVGRGAGVQHLVPAAAVVVPAGRGALLGVDRALRRLAADLLGGALDALGEDVAEALALRDHLEQPVRAVHVAEAEPEADLLLGEVALLHALHHPAAHPAELVDVHAGAVDPVLSQLTASLSVRPICQPAPDQPSYSGSSTRSPAIVR